MPTEDWGQYEQGLTAGTEVSSTYEGRHITCDASELVSTGGSGVAVKGSPCVFGTTGLQAVGVCFTSGTLTDKIAIDTEGIWNLAVLATNDGADAGGVVVAGDPLYINVATCIISKIKDPATQIPFGYALGGIAQDTSVVIAVKVHWDPRCHWLGDDEPMYFGRDRDLQVVWTEEELEFSGDRTTGGDGDYYRTIHCAHDAIALGAGDHWGTISTYTTIDGGAGGASWGFAGAFTLVTATMDFAGYYGAVMAEVKNEADNSVTACALFCRWDNDSAVGFGGVMHSFIRFEDNSSALNVQCLFELYLMDATAAAAADVIVCQAGAANAASHVIKISANGVPYWIMMDSTPPA